MARALQYETVPTQTGDCIVTVSRKGTTTFDVTAGSAQQREGVLVEYWLVIRLGDTDKLARGYCLGNGGTSQTLFWSGLFNVSRFMGFD